MVLVCHKHDFIFLKTHKTASTSIEMALEALCVPPGQTITETRPYQVSEYGIVGRRGPEHRISVFQKLFGSGNWRNHASAAFVYRKIGHAEWERRKKITTIRNPFDRTVSYYHFKANQRTNPPTDFDEIRKDFAAFCQSREWTDDRRIVFLKGKFIIQRAVRFEHMAEDLVQLAQDMNLPLSPDAVPVTKSMAKLRKDYDVPDYFTPKLVDVVKKRLSWVFDHYDYPLEPQPKYAPQSEVMA